MTTLLLFVVAWVGGALALSEIRWFRRARLVDRLSPYSPSSARTSTRSSVSVESVVDVVGPLARSAGAAVSRAVGVDDDLATRLHRLHSAADPTAFRVRQIGWSVAALGAGAAATVTLGPPPALAAVLLLGLPVLAVLIPEQQLATALSTRRRRLVLELPVVAEQLGMLLSAGYSLGNALGRLAERGHGPSAEDLRRACARIRYGTGEIEALREWAAAARVPAVDRLVAILALNREAGDLGRFISEEARAIRRDTQRDLVETMERRAQQVWIPVTVAALVPGTLFLVVPFLDAMRLFTTS
ncbi:type II secretion system F family protein [Actinomarinicola tropica]|uniref:Type II secretion system protein GspF domain-containing protein n=1 Tax=Actinomarinicola tropica TaxID=2789776 RepID=A0A5Q2RL48_9ACTN|nr:type II secretion system F family protein [Actinomarinicola tropica]QGG95652.1 hypothetical protein GH723_11405 [Actinomarinicola tropica]